MTEKIKIAEQLNLKVPLILASKSPRRKHLLETLGFEFSIYTSNVVESAHPLHGLPGKYAEELSLKKALDVAQKVEYPAVVVGADTIVVLEDEILNKPKDKADAFRMLKTLSGRTHVVYTGIALVETGTGRHFSSLQSTEVTFRELFDNEINAYIESGSPLDKAGAYGIQDDFGAVFVRHIKGCYYNIVGLPLELLYSSLKSFLNFSV